MNAQHKTVAEFFAGIGLMRIGLENEIRKFLNVSQRWQPN
jgi:site-specific DNA-cytosine methylase